MCVIKFNFVLHRAVVVFFFQFFVSFGLVWSDSLLLALYCIVFVFLLTMNLKNQQMEQQTEKQLKNRIPMTNRISPYQLCYIFSPIIFFSLLSSNRKEQTIFFLAHWNANRSHKTFVVSCTFFGVSLGNFQFIECGHRPLPTPTFRFSLSNNSNEMRFSVYFILHILFLFLLLIRLLCIVFLF